MFFLDTLRVQEIELDFTWNKSFFVEVTPEQKAIIEADQYLKIIDSELFLNKDFQTSETAWRNFNTKTRFEPRQSRRWNWNAEKLKKWHRRIDRGTLKRNDWRRELTLTRKQNRRFDRTCKIFVIFLYQSGVLISFDRGSSLWRNLDQVFNNQATAKMSLFNHKL